MGGPACTILRPPELDNRNSPAIDSQLMCIDRVGTASSAGSIYLEVDEQVSQSPAQRALKNCRWHFGSWCRLHPLQPNHRLRSQCCPGVRRSGCGARCWPATAPGTGNIGRNPVALGARAQRVLPTLGVAGALRSQDHRLPVGHYGVHVHFEVFQLRRIDHIDVGVIDVMGGTGVFGKGDVVDPPPPAVSSCKTRCAASSAETPPTGYEVVPFGAARCARIMFPLPVIGGIQIGPDLMALAGMRLPPVGVNQVTTMLFATVGSAGARSHYGDG